MLDLKERTETAVVLDLTEDAASLRAAWERAAWLLELSDIQAFSMERMARRSSEWERLGTTADLAGALVEVEGGIDYLPVAA